MNIRQFFNFEDSGKRLPKISIPEKSFASLNDILDGKRTKHMGELAKTFGLYFRKMNLEKSNPIMLNLFFMVRNLKLLSPPENIKSFIHTRSIINHLLAHIKTEQSIIMNLLFNTCYRIVFMSNSKEGVLKRSRFFCTFFEEIILHANNK